MYRSGTILGALALFVAAGATLLSPLCAPCAVVLLGLAAGYLAGVFDKPLTSNATSRVGAIGGAIGGSGAILGQGIGTIINAIAVGPQRAQQVSQVLGLPVTGGPGFEGSYWVTTIGGGVCFGLLDVLLMALFGALGGLIWWQTAGKSAAPHSPTIAS